MDLEVRTQTETLRREREAIENPLNQLLSQMTQIKSDNEQRQAEIESIEKRREKIEGDNSQI